MEPSRPVALLTLDNGFQVLHDFTMEARSLAQALERYRPWRPMQARSFRPSSFDGKFAAVCNMSMWKLDNAANMYKARAGAQLTASAMSAVAAFLARTPGRKNLIWR